MSSQRSLKHKTVLGLGWSAIDSIASQGITFLVGLVLARLLSPSEFGTIGLAMILVALFNTIVDSGFSSALIRKQNVLEVDLNTTFIFNFVISVVLYAVCYSCAPYISNFFHDSDLIKVTRWISLVLIINALAIIHRTLLVKAVDFKTQAIISVIASILSGIVGIWMAYEGFGVYSLVGQQLSRQVTNTILLWINSKWKPKLEFSYDSFRNLFSFGGKLLLSSIIDTIFNELSVIFIGRIYTTATLGQYSRAKQFSSIFSSNVSAVTQRVTYPILSDIQDNRERLVYSYRRMIKMLMLLVGLGTAVIASTSKSVILILLGPKWAEAIIYLQLLAFVEITIPLKNFNLNLLQVYGRSDYILFLSVIKRFIEIGALLLGLISIYWMLIGFAIAGVIGFLLNALFTMKVSNLSVITQVKDLLPSLIVCSIVGIAMYLISFLISNIYLCLIIQLVVGFALFTVLSKMFRLNEIEYLKDEVNRFINKGRKQNGEP